MNMLHSAHVIVGPVRRLIREEQNELKQNWINRKPASNDSSRVDAGPGFQVHLGAARSDRRTGIRMVGSNL